VDAEDLAVDDSAEGEVVKDVAAVAPDVCAPVLALALVVEAVDLGDLPRLVVAADEGDAIRVADLEQEQEEKRLDRVEAPVDKVALETRSGRRARGASEAAIGGAGAGAQGASAHHEEIGRARTLAAMPEQLHQVKELAVDVATDLSGKRRGSSQSERTGTRAGACCLLFNDADPKPSSSQRCRQREWHG
jgi:hypothetical protein